MHLVDHDTITDMHVTVTQWTTCEFSTAAMHAYDIQVSALQDGCNASD